MMNKEIEVTTEAASNKNPQEKWELIKKHIKKTTVEFSKQKIGQDKLIIANLSEKLNEYESNLPLNEEENKLMENTRADLEEKTMERIKGVMFRSKAKWYEDGERNSKYFFALEKAKYNAKTCYAIINEEGQEINSVEGILENQRKFYTELYSEEQEVCFNLENKYNIKVPEEIRQKQESQLEITDLQDAMKGMKNNRTPGEDGIPVDFYKVFWSNLKNSFWEMMIYSHEQNKLHNTARKGILNLIPKGK